MSSPIVEHPPPSRLTIGYLMLWMAGSGIILVLVNAFYRPQENSGAWLTYFVASTLGYSILEGTQVAGVLLFAVRRMWRVGGFPSQPGHWLLIVNGLTAVAYWIGHVALGFPTERNWAIVELPASLIAAGGFGLAFRHTPARRWKAIFLLLTLQAGAASVLNAFVASDMLDFFWSHRLHVWNLTMQVYASRLFVVPGLAWVSVCDVRWHERGCRPDFLHWAGVVSALGVQVFEYVMELVAPPIIL